MMKGNSQGELITSRQFPLTVPPYCGIQLFITILALHLFELLFGKLKSCFACRNKPCLNSFNCIRSEAESSGRGAHALAASKWSNSVMLASNTLNT